MKNQYVSYYNMEHYLAEHKDALSDPARIEEMNRYFIDNHMAFESISPFQQTDDPIIMEDEEFFEGCDNLPVSLDCPAAGMISAARIFPPNYECFITRHLTHFPSYVHSHDFFEICYIWSGSCIQTAGSKDVPMIPGDFFIIPPGTEHKIEITDPESVIFNILVRPHVFQTSMFAFLSRDNAISMFFGSCLLQKHPSASMLIHTPNHMGIKRIIRHLTFESYMLQSFFCDFSVGILNQLFCYLIQFGEVSTDYLGLPSNQTLTMILRDISENYRTVTLSSLAKKYYFSEEYLSRLIKKATGTNFSVLVKDTRIDAAKLLITRTTSRLDSISELVGYADYSSFSKLFKKDTGYTPSQYRKQFSELSPSELPEE